MAWLSLAIGLLLWSYWPVIVALFKDWQRDGDYSVGQLVPLVALYLVWRDRLALGKCAARPCWWGIGLIVLAQIARFYGLVYLYESIERYSLIPTIAGIILLIAGWKVLWRLPWVVLFLLLMVPLPGKVHNTISGPLQTSATIGAVFVLEILGVTVAREGNLILLNHTVPLAVAEACSGLRMLMAFVVVTAVLAYLVKRPRWQKGVLLGSSIPIAIVSNVLRLCVTVVLFLGAGSEAAERFFHDFAGLAMMPLAVLLLAAELWLMRRLVLPDEAAPAEAGSTQHRNNGPAGKTMRRRS